MVSKSDRAKPLIRSLGESGITKAMLADMVHRGQIAVGATHPPMTLVHPETDAVVVFRDLFNAGLRFLLDPMFVETLRLHNMFLYQLTPNSIARLNLYF